MNEVRTYKKAKVLVERRFAFLIHVAVYIPTVLILVVINLRTDPEPPWAGIAAWAWGIALATHFLAVFVFADLHSRTPLAATLRERRVSFYLHFFAFANSAVLLYIAHGQFPAGVDSIPNVLGVPGWVVPLIFWGIGVFYHWFFTFVLRGWRIKKLKQAWMLKVMEDIDGISRPEKSGDTEQPDSASDSEASYSR